MDPATGEILALANAPTFNPNSYARAPEADRRNRAIQDLYEPGSTFKIVTASAALEEGLISPDDPIDVSAGMIRFGSRQIDDVHRYGVLSFTDVIVKSSNVGAIKVGLRLGPERLGRYVSRFGFGQTLLPDFRGENAGIVWNPARLDPGAVASVSMGYQVGVTPVQMAAAVSSVANGGTLYEPRIVRAIIKDGQRAASPAQGAAAHGVRAHGRAADRDHGGGRRARHGQGGADRRLHDRRQDRHRAQDHQRRVLAVGVQRLVRRLPAVAQAGADDHRRHRFAARQGLHTAAPWRRRSSSASPKRRCATRHCADRQPGAAGARGGARPITRADATISRRSDWQPSWTAARDGLMPDLRGMSARDANRTLTQIGMTGRLNGDGFVLEQSPAAGTVLRTRHGLRC